MKTLEILGGNPIKGEICISGAKNASMPIIIASILTNKPCTIHNIPYVSDVINLLKILINLGTRVTIDGNTTENPSKSIIIHSQNLKSEINDHNITKQIRTSILLLGPLLAKNGYVKLSKPGGCNIGDRKIDLHLMVMEKLGATINETDDYIEATTNGLVGAEITFPIISVGATENAIMASVIAKGTTILRNVAIEPEIDDLITFLNKCGAKISKTAERELTVSGVPELLPCEHKVISDRIEAVTYAIASAITNGRVILHHCPITVFEHLLEIMASVGIQITQHTEESVIIERNNIHLSDSPHFDTNPYPLFPTDIQPQFMALLATVHGRSFITENIFENRLQHTKEMQKLGANIIVNGNQVEINGTQDFNSGNVTSTDLRAGAALVLLGLFSKAKTIVENAEYIDRGYQNFVKNLTRCGANIKIKYTE